MSNVQLVIQDMTVLGKMKDSFEISFVFAISHEKREASHEKNDHYKHFFIETTCFMMVYEKTFVTVLMQGFSFL